MVQFGTRSVIGVAVLGIAVFAVAIPAQAADGRGRSPHDRAAGTTGVSEFFAGYTADGSGSGFTRLFVVPELDCSSGAFLEAVQVGIGDPPAAGDFSTVLAVADVYCQAGSAGYGTYVSAGAQAAAGAASAGDRLRFEITYSGGNATATTTNLTNPAGTVSVTGAVAEEPLHFGSFGVGQEEFSYPVPTFDSIRLRTNKVDGSKIRKSTTTKIDHVEDDLKIKTGRLRKGSFKLTFVNN